MSPRRNVPPKLSLCSWTFGRHFQRQLLPTAIDAEAELAVAVAGDDALHVLETYDRIAVDAGDHVTRLEAGGGRRHPRLHLADARRDGMDADGEVHGGVDQNREKKIRGRPGEHHGCTLPDGLRLEGAAALLRRHALERILRRLARGILVVHELHVAAERNPGDAPARTLAIGEAPDLPPKADGEGANRDAAPARDDEVAELVDEDHDAEHDEEGHHGKNRRHRCGEERKH